ncbi:restriction endonuclease subunit S [Lysinibacillus macroides]|uniref:Type I restriction modification DNA specificity domain-containing protein n=1 Tax=Lysinibacillus macroides TaxID=33935 RepID=A0A0N0CVM2_9BACI|nr:restriction endonuclease subunit S [Lysinibacillus macroides]KOY81871.1 hypothetical protein ADM90_13250 [Lysinibacillus macroides]QPR67980.1 restriction endonuclease subunit S [Lysinibacillus macroides]
MEFVRLEDVCEFINGDRGKNYPKSNEFIDAGIPFINAGHINNSRVNFSKMNYISEEVYEKLGSGKIQNKDIIFCLRGSLGKSALIDFDKGAIASSLVILRNKNEKRLNTSYLMYLLNSQVIYSQINKTNTGSSQPNLSAANVKNFIVPLPDLRIQHKVVQVLDIVQELINKRKQQLEALDQVIQSMFLEMFGDPITNVRGWEISPCKDVAIKIGSGATPKGGNASYKDSGISLIRSMNVYNNKFSYKDLAFIDEEQAEKLNNVEVFKNDVLLNITGASVARSCIVPTDILPARVNQHVAIIRPKEEMVNYIFLSYLFTNEIYQRYLWQIATNGGATREAITKQQIEKLPVILPPLYLQNDFASKVEQIEKQKSLMQSSIEELENMYNALLQKAFNGNLFNEEKVSNL